MLWVILMATSSEALATYSEALDTLRVLAQADLLAWWQQTAPLGWSDQKNLLVDPFVEIVSAYGAQAAASAADYVFIQRSLDDALAGLDYPTVASPVGADQAVKSFDWSTFLKDADFVNDNRTMALKKLQGTLNRLVLSPARDTVFRATQDAGTGFARVPEPGACPFCLMLASRGAVYTRKSALQAKGMRAFHDHCRCVAIECHYENDVPRINRDLQNQWRALSDKLGGTSPSLEQWGKHLNSLTPAT